MEHNLSAGNAYATFWDWRSARPDEEIDSRVAALKRLGAKTAYKREVDAGRDDICLVISDSILDDDEASAVFDEWFDDVWEYHWEDESSPIRLLGVGSGDHLVSAVHGRVVGFATTPLQFQPRPPQRQYRDQLRRLISGLPPTGALFGQFEAETSRQAVDLENVLLYNLGTSTFRPLNLTSVTLDRLLERHLGGKWKARSAYSTSPLLGGWTREADIATWSRIEMRGRHIDAAEYWAWTRRALADRSVQVTSHSKLRNLGVSITLHGSWSIQLADMVKPLIDGILCGFSHHDAVRDEVTLALARRVRLSQEETRLLLRPIPGEFMAGRAPIRLRPNGGATFDAPDDSVVHLDVGFAHPKAPAAAISGAVMTMVERPLPTKGPAARALVDLEDYLPSGGPDPDHPCPKCGSIPDAPADGSGRYCPGCGWTWIIDRSGGSYRDW